MFADLREQHAAQRQCVVPSYTPDQELLFFIKPVFKQGCFPSAQALDPVGNRPILCFFVIFLYLYYSAQSKGKSTDGCHLPPSGTQP